MWVLMHEMRWLWLTIKVSAKGKGKRRRRPSKSDSDDDFGYETSEEGSYSRGEPDLVRSRSQRQKKPPANRRRIEPSTLPSESRSGEKEAPDSNVAGYTGSPSYGQLSSNDPTSKELGGPRV